MLLYPLFALVTSFPRTFIIKGDAHMEEIHLLAFSLLMTPFPLIAFINEEARGCNNEEAIDAINEAIIGAIIAPRNPSSHFFFFQVLLLL